MKKYLYYILFLVFTTSISCSKKYKYNHCTTFSDKTLPQNQQINLKGSIMIFDEEVLNPMRIHCIDSILFLTNKNASLFLDKYNLNTQKKTGACIPFGSGPNDLQIVSQIQQIGTAVWLFDQMQKKLFQYSLPEFYTSETPIPSQTITLSDAASNVLVLPTGKIIATTYNLEGKLFSFFDMSGKLLEHKTEYPDYGSALMNYERIESYFCQMTLSPDMKNILLAYKRTDLIEIYDLEGNLKKRIQGPDCFYPALKQKGTDNNIRVSSKIGETRDGYFCPTIYNNEIWILYSGKYYNPQQAHGYLNNCILAFDWDGNLIRRYNLDIPIFAFTIDKQKNEIYGITDNPEMQIIKFDIS